MSHYRVEYYVKPAEATRIAKLGGVGWEQTEQQVMDGMARNANQYYVSGDGQAAMLEVEASLPDYPYLKTIPNDMRLDDLAFVPRRYA
jgi:hypothetical protein